MGRRVELVEQLTIEGPRMVVRPARQLAPFVPHDFEVTYPDDVDLGAMPAHIALLPFIWNVAPVIWAVGGDYELDVLDRRVADSLEAVRAEFRAMYPGLRWHGALGARSLVETEAPPPGRFDRAALFSGGVDSTWTALRHAGPELLLISIWGSDTALDNEREWRGLEAHLRAFAAEHAGGLAVVRSNHRAIRVARLSALIPELRYWYMQVQHSLVFAGLAGPLAYRHGIPVVYVAATVDEHILSAAVTGSRPSIDDRISLATARVVHDAFEDSRQAKIAAIVAYFRGSGRPPPAIRVCFEDPGADGGNCGRCEKCMRTIAGLVVAGGDPVEYGFPTFVRAQIVALPERFEHLARPGTGVHWQDLQLAARAAQDDGSPFMEWLRTYDFEAATAAAAVSRQTPRHRALNALALRWPRPYAALRRAKRALGRRPTSSPARRPRRAPGQ
jgi:hypothetical protein